MRTLISCVVLVVLASAGVASAQPGQTPVGPPPGPAPYPPAPQPQQPQVPPPYQYQQPPPVMLTADEQDLLARGEITDGQHIGGGVASLLLGWGIGQAIQGRWSDTGWIFTLGEAASLTALIYGISQEDCFLVFDECNSDSDGEGFIVAGVVGIVVFRVWEVIDAFAGPSRHNRKVRELRMRLGYPPVMYGKRATPFLVPPREGAGAIAGVSLQF